MQAGITERAASVVNAWLERILIITRSIAIRTEGWFLKKAKDHSFERVNEGIVAVSGDFTHDQIGPLAPSMCTIEVHEAETLDHAARRLLCAAFSATTAFASACAAGERDFGPVRTM